MTPWLQRHRFPSLPVTSATIIPVWFRTTVTLPLRDARKPDAEHATHRRPSWSCSSVVKSAISLEDLCVYSACKSCGWLLITYKVHQRHDGQWLDDAATHLQTIADSRLGNSSLASCRAGAHGPYGGHPSNSKFGWSDPKNACMKQQSAQHAYTKPSMPIWCRKLKKGGYQK